MLPTKPAAQPRGAKGPYNPINKEDEYMRKREVGINIRVTETEKKRMELNARRCSLTLYLISKAQLSEICRQGKLASPGI